LRNTTVVSLAGLAAAELFPGRGAVVRGVDLGGGTADPSGFLLPEEMEMLETMTSLKRRRQWLGGRLAAKKAAAAHLGCDPAGIVITVREDGSPELRRRGRREKAPLFRCSHLNLVPSCHGGKSNKPQLRQHAQRVLHRPPAGTRNTGVLKTCSQTFAAIGHPAPLYPSSWNASQLQTGG